MSPSFETQRHRNRNGKAFCSGAAAASKRRFSCCIRVPSWRSRTETVYSHALYTCTRDRGTVSKPMRFPCQTVHYATAWRLRSIRVSTWIEQYKLNSFKLNVDKKKCIKTLLRWLLLDDDVIQYLFRVIYWWARWLIQCSSIPVVVVFVFSKVV